ncbi:hypothetical protein [Dactylosporangium sp. NPDC048998]|uniref:hypothetical protein n=1 Tax=Dactylosporangium sp. NPDC048998 TaxID=3363976 RepID=UPI00371CB1DC
MAGTDEDGEIVRAILEEAADMPVDRVPNPAAMTRRVRRQRRVRAVEIGGASIAIVAVALSVAVAIGRTGGSGDGTNAVQAGGPVTSDGAAPGPTANSGSASTPGPPDGGNASGLTGIACGQPFTVKYVPQGPANVRIAAAGVHRGGGAAAMPDVDVLVSADQAVRISGSPAQLGIQAVIVRDGVTVDRIGGADRPEDATSTPGQDSGGGAMARSWPVAPGAPHAERISRSRWTACPGVDWAAINAAPEQYQLVVLMPAPMVFGPAGPLADPSDTVIGAAVTLAAAPAS